MWKKGWRNLSKPTKRHLKTSNLEVLKCLNYYCVVQKRSNPPPPYTEGNRNSGGRGSKRRQFPRRYRVAFPAVFLGLPVKLISKLSVILLLIGVPKRYHWSFYSRSAECIFHALHNGLCKKMVVGSWIKFHFSTCCLVTQHIVAFNAMWLGSNKPSSNMFSTERK